MTGIVYISRDYGVNVSIVRLTTTDTAAVALGANYILNQTVNIALANSAVGIPVGPGETPFSWFTNDMILLAAADGDFFVTISADFSTLILPAKITANNITAHAGGGQAGGVHLTAQINRITVAASPGDSVVLPPATPGQEIIIINNGANPIQVYGAGTDTINGQPDTVGVSQMPNSVAMYVSAQAGLWESSEVVYGYADGNLPTYAYSNGLTAHSGGTQAGALALVAYNNVVATVAAVGDSVKLPASAVGMQIVVANEGVNAMQVYGAGTDTINGVATATGVTQQPGAVCYYNCAVAGAWLVDVNSLANNIKAGSSGSAGEFISYPATAAKGSLIFAAVANTGNTNTTVSNDAMAQASVMNIPDPGVASAQFVVAPAALVNGNLIQAEGTVGLVQDSGIPANGLQILSASVALTQAQVQGMYATPVQIIAPVASKVIVPVQATFYTNFQTAAFAAGGVGVLQYAATVHGAGTNSLAATVPAAEITAASSQLYNLGANVANVLTGMTDAGVYMSNETQPFTGGNAASTFVVTVSYYLVTATV